MKKQHSRQNGFDSEMLLGIKIFDNCTTDFVRGNGKYTGLKLRKLRLGQNWYFLVVFPLFVFLSTQSWLSKTVI